MLALPDTAMPETPVKFMSQRPVLDLSVNVDPVKQTILACLGFSLIMAALGVWAVPVDAGDVEMQLIKLLFSVTMLAIGALFVKSLDRNSCQPEIELDTQRRLLRVLSSDKEGRRQEQVCYDISEFSEITLRDRYLTARDAYGKEVISIPIRNTATEKTICDALSQML